MANAGDFPAIMRPNFYIGAVVNGIGPTWPSRLGTKGQTWPNLNAAGGWYKAKGFGNGIQVQIQDPQTNLQTSDLGITGQVSSGAHGIHINCNLEHPIDQFLQWMTKMASRTLAATGGTAEVRTLTLTGTATASGNAIVTVDGSSYAVAITSGDTAAAAATKIGTAANYTPNTIVADGWTPSTAGSTAVYTATSPGAHTGTFSFIGVAGLTGSFATTTPGVNPTYSPGSTRWFDPNFVASVSGFALGIEGIAAAGSLSNRDLLVRVIAHNVNQGGNTSLQFNHSGTNARFALPLSGQCLPRSISYTETVNTGFDPILDLDPNGRVTWWVANAT